MSLGEVKISLDKPKMFLEFPKMKNIFQGYPWKIQKMSAKKAKDTPGTFQGFLLNFQGYLFTPKILGYRSYVMSKNEMFE